MMLINNQRIVLRAKNILLVLSQTIITMYKVKKLGFSRIIKNYPKFSETEIMMITQERKK